jgi:uncharacterized membrane protein YgcG
LLASGRPQIEAALGNLLETHNVQLYVLFVESTDGRTVTEYADEVARQNSFGGNHALLVVALSDRTDAIWRSSPLMARLTDAELQDVLTRQVEPLLGRGDYTGAVIAAANGIGMAAGGLTQQPAQPSGSRTGLLPILLVFVAVVAAVWILRVISSRRRQGQSAKQYERQTDQLAKEANALLIHTDESLRDAEEEIGFAEAQFSEAEVVPYREALAKASDELKAAFAVR